MRILIVGSSIAGPAAAFWLSRSGADVTVIERASALREGGYCVDIRGTALEVIARMGLRETLRPFEANTQSNAVVDARGRTFGQTARGFGVIDPEDIEILRGDLARVLYDATKGDVDYRFNTTLGDVDTEHYDVIIGADGVHSETRATFFGPEERFVRPLGSCMAIWSAPNFLGLDREQLLFNGVNRIASIKSTNDNARLYIATFWKGAEATRAAATEAFATAGWEFPHLVDEMQRASDFYADITCQIRLPSLTSGNVALIGDAGYCPSPLSGQGTSLALVGAYMLAHALRHSHSNDDAFAKYNAAMLPFAQTNQQVADKIAQGFAPESPFQVRLRSTMMAMLPYMPWAPWIMKLAMGGVRAAARSLELPCDDGAECPPIKTLQTPSSKPASPRTPPTTRPGMSMPIG